MVKGSVWVVAHLQASNDAGLPQVFHSSQACRCAQAFHKHKHKLSHSLPTSNTSINNFNINASIINSSSQHFATQHHQQVSLSRDFCFVVSLFSLAELAQHSTILLARFASPQSLGCMKVEAGWGGAKG